jgi:Protein of unknown function (DUF1588)/Protein of unknown function (DUF1592)/Protein of unknown function (DUF1595)/Protein of unknown function (DUF1585)
VTSARTVAWLVASGLALAACGRTDRNPSTTTPTSGGGGAVGSTPTGGATNTPGGAGAPPTKDNCEDAALDPGPAPLSRLGSDQLNLSLRELLDEQAAGTLAWLPEGAYENEGHGPISFEAIQRLHSLAHTIAVRLTEDESSGWLAECDVSALGEAACQEQLTKTLLERAYRRPATEEDLQEMADVFANGERLGGDFRSGMRAVAEVALQNPDFLYLVELGNGAARDGSIPLTGYETATRVAYFLTRSPPDAQLRTVAARGPIPANELEDQARRLLSTPESGLALSRYYARLLGLAIELDWLPESFPPELAESATEASRRFIQEAFAGPGSLTQLLTAPTVWTDGSLAAFYGYAASGTDWQKVVLDPARSAGILTQPAFFLGTSHRSSGSAVQRGLRVLTQVLCEESLPPPDGVIQLQPVAEPSTMRQKLEQSTAPATCADCHRNIDPLGFAFEHFDAVGKWRDLDNGLPVDSSGSLEFEDLQGSFSGAPELMTLLAQSHAVKQCFVQGWLKAGYGRPIAAGDECRARELAQRWAESDEGLSELLVQIALSPRFRYRPER